MRAGILGWLLVAGCQSGGQTDLVTRELRTQEDQIYAMEDYLAQYQQLLCQYRSENEELKRQLAESAGGEALPAPSQQEKPARGNRRPRTNGPSFQSPGRTPVRKDDDRAPPEMETIEPDVPPLEETTSDEQPPAIVVTSREEAGEASLASGDTEAGGSAAVESTQSMSELLQLSHVPTKFVQIRGAVVANDEGGGPRLKVDLEPMTVTFEPTRFAGAVSMVVIDAAESGNPNIPLASWNYSSSDAEVVFDEMPLHQSMRFFLELPPVVPTVRETELWVRLMSEGGDMVIGHVRVDLSGPGKFASMVGGAAPRDGWDETREGGSLAAIADRDNSVVTPVFGLGDEEGWTIARPDRPGQTPVGKGDRGSQWRAATRPLPVVFHEGSSARPKDFLCGVRQAVSLESAPAANGSPASVVRAAPVWSQERGGGQQAAAKSRSDGPRAEAVVRPVWSAER